MTFLETKELFLLNWKEGDFYDSSITTYRRKIDVFFEFLINNCGVNDNNYREILRGIGNDKIVQSSVYYVKEYDIKFKVTVESFFTVIKCYFDFISKNYELRNENFDSTLKYEDLKKEIQLTIDKMNLNKSEQKSPIISNSLNKVIKYCDEKINLLSIKELIGNQKVNPKSYNKPLAEFISGIITKIVILTAIKNQVISTLKISDYNKDLNSIKINNFWLHIPDTLGIQMKKYLSVWNELVIEKSDNSPLFINKQGEAINNNYNLMFEVLQSSLGNRSAESVAKYTIMELIKKGANINLIQDLTSFGFDTCLHCQELVNEEKNKEDLKSKNRYIDSKIRSLEIFDLL
jgi:hypothetical protein